MRRIPVLAVLVVLPTLACDKQSPPPSPPSLVTDAPDAGPDPSDDPREDMMRATLARVRIIQDEVAALRELAFAHPVPAERQEVPEFRRVLIAEIDKYFPAVTSKKSSKALFHLGVLAEQTDLATAMIELAVGQVAAYYNPDKGTFYAVTLSEDQTWLDIMTAHELVHGLQDQNFDLRHYIGEPSPKHPSKVELNEDQINARRFVVEGEASYIMWMYQAAKALDAEVATEAVLTRARTVVAMTAAVSWQSMVSQADEQAASSGDEKATRLSLLPPFLVAPTLESYTSGAAAVATVHGAGGWAAVSALFSNPPESTEQLLHPLEKLIDARDTPTIVALPDLSKRFGAPLLEETLGELGWRIYLETWKIPAPDVAAAGWDGDRLAVYETPEGLVGLVAFVWDSEDDAIEFENAFRRSLRVRTKTGTDETPGKITRYRRQGDGGEILVVREGVKMWVVDGASGARADSFMTTLRAGAVFTQ